MTKKQLLSLFLLPLSACAPTAGPDKSATGAILGAAWGAGAGAVVGNQLNSTGPGIAIGSGVGAAGGLLSGMGLDIAEGAELRQQRELYALQAQVSANERSLQALQRELDEKQQKVNAGSLSKNIYFDAGKAYLRLGTVSELGRLAEDIRNNPFVSQIELHAHADDFKEEPKNKELSKARGKSVANFLASHGLALEQIEIKAHGAEKPLSNPEALPSALLNKRVEVLVK